jgi:hypothetical protein
MKPQTLGLFAIILAGSYYAVYKWAESSVEAQYNADTARIVEQALLSHQEDIRDAYSKNTDLMQKAQLDKQRAKRLRAEMASLTTSCGLRSGNLRLLQQAVDHPALQPSGDPAESFTEGDSVAPYCLTAIEEYNKVAVQLNNLIDEL